MENTTVNVRSSNVGTGVSSIKPNNEPVIEKQTKGKVITRKKSVWQEFKDGMINEDIKDIKRYIFCDVFRPAIKQAIAQTITKAINDIFGTNIGVPNTVNSIRGVIPYSQMNKAAVQQTARPSCDYDNIIVESLEEAEGVYNYLSGILSEYNKVRVADLFEAVGLTAPHTLQNYGWRDLSMATTRRVAIDNMGNYGYLLVLPRPSLIM